MRWLLVTILMLLTLVGQCAQADVQWRVMRTKHFMIYYTAGDESVAQQAGNTAEKWQAILAQKMPLTSVGTVPIYLYPDRRTFSEATGYAPGSSIVGLAHVRTRKIQVDASGAFTSVEGVIPHELVHVYTSRRLKGSADRLPIWMHEGLAKYWAGDWTGNDADKLADTAGGGRIIPLAKLSRAFPTDDEGRATAYVESYSAVKYMAETYSSQALLDMFDELEKGEMFPNALFNSIGRTPEQFDDDWQKYLWDKYGTARMMRIVSALVSGVMAILAVFAFRARLIKKRRKAAEFQREVKQDGQDDQDMGNEGMADG